METWVWIVIAAAAVAVLLLLTWVVARRRRQGHLQDRFGPEYERTVASEGRRHGEQRLADVEKRHEELEIRPLTPAARDRYLEEWRQAEARFVNEPEDAARAAERVVVRILDDRGYPTDVDVEERAAHVAVDYPEVVERYRHGHAMLVTDGEGADTENLRKAMIDFRAVFETLVVADEAPAETSRHSHA